MVSPYWGVGILGIVFTAWGIFYTVYTLKQYFKESPKHPNSWHYFVAFGLGLMCLGVFCTAYGFVMDYLYNLDLTIVINLPTE